MTVSLRERRRQQTARDIQLATLKLAVERGLENVTTEEIAASAGVSTRTFFNYYVNKETAAIGAPPAFRKEDKNALCDGTGALRNDLKRFLHRHMENLTKDEPILRMIGTVLRSNEKARGILEGFIIMERDELTEHLCRRVQNRQVAAALASSATDAIARTIHLWEQEKNLTLGAALDMVWDGLIESSHLLASTSKDA
ncbi:TetR/AcrR family transcriptional regulator [Citreicella sp. C3M06]|uniref:TetR/AcrR family transcriptional regulator n=1 Tax=Citreicella sp. C3M06 TaxID=2841564 RepID=UPI001C0866C0|nr:TetR/AcrR family transcriptional regulator [Citreicella sp. C3M06]MBU2960277.1 TetR/AcrR family transcriptional regulator [Citreicella sp. C3M06]